VHDERLVAQHEKRVVKHAASLVLFVVRDGGLFARDAGPLAALPAR
jgi:hypothetical protein